MNSTASVEVLLGNDIEVPSERRFIGRLRADLMSRGQRALILANVQVGRNGERQLDVFVAGERRHVHVELKTARDPLVGGPNGRWHKLVGGNQVPLDGNPIDQARGIGFALSDSFRDFARNPGVPGPRRGRFFKDFDTVVCVAPTVPDGSRIEPDPYIDVLGYDALLDRLQRRGPTLAWSDEHWRAFAREHGLFPDADSSPAGRARRAGDAVTADYNARYLHEQTRDMPPLVPTGVFVNGRRADRPDLTAELTAGRAVALHGPSGAGKTLWARATSIELARRGALAIWIASDVCDPSFELSVERAIAPYSGSPWKDVLAGADAAGRPVVFVIDNIDQVSSDVRAALLGGVRHMLMRLPQRGVLLTGQSSAIADELAGCLSVQLALPDDAERRELLAAYNAPEIFDRCEAFVTPLDLSLAAECADDLPPDASVTGLLDRYVDRVLAGDDRLRAAMRDIARRMHIEIRPSLARPDVARALRRDRGLSDAALQSLFATRRLLTVSHGRVTFRHERIEHFFAAEALMLDIRDGHALAALLNEPQQARLRADMIALEHDDARLGVMLGSCEHPGLLADAARGRLGARARRISHAVIADGLRDAYALTAARDITFDPGLGTGLDGQWVMARTPSAALTAQLTAAGRLLAEGMFIEQTGRLLDATDAVCAALAADAEGPPAKLATLMFAATYALGGRPTLPAGALTCEVRRGADAPAGVATAERLLRRTTTPGPGTLYVVLRLLRFGHANTGTVAEVIIACVASRLYHLRMEALHVATDRGFVFDADERGRIVAALRAIPPMNMFVDSAVAEALSALGDIAPLRTLEDINAEIADVLRRPQDADAARAARNIYSNQFEDDIVGPYHEAVASLPKQERERLLAMALAADPVDVLHTRWLLSEFEDLSDPFVREAVIRYVARVSPGDRVVDPNGVMAAVTVALRLLVEAGEPLPEPHESGSADPAWRAALTVIYGAFADDAGRAVNAEPVRAAWAALTGEHRDVLASLMASLHAADAWAAHDKRSVAVQGLIAAAMPPAGIDALVRSLEHPDETRTLLVADWDRDRAVIDLLGRIGGRSAAEALRGFAGDRELGEIAVTAARAIEARLAARPQR